jgi:DNA-3-methyladenine glycosylase
VGDKLISRAGRDRDGDRPARDSDGELGRCDAGARQVSRDGGGERVMSDGGRAGTLLPRSFFDRRSEEVAPALLGCVIEHERSDGLVAVALTEVEAYAGALDPASHAFRGQTRRNAVMFGPPGHAYVYFTYGMHFCVNLVCLPEGTAEAVLLRAGAVTEGTEVARQRRAAARSDADLARGPARLCQALAIDRGFDGADVCDPASPLRIFGPRPGRAPAPGQVRSGPRVGVRVGAEVAWRFWIDGDPTVSTYRPYAPRRRPRATPVTTPPPEDGTMQQ